MSITCDTSYKVTALLKCVTEFKSYLSFLLMTEPITDEGGEETGVPGENPRRLASINAKVAIQLILQSEEAARVRPKYACVC